MKNRRRAKRIPSILEGRITLRGHQSHISCTVRNLSETGAQIWLPSEIDLPQEFELEIPKIEQLLKVRLMWSKAQSHGVAFLTPLQSHVGEDVTGLIEALQASEQTNAAETPPEEKAQRPGQPKQESARWQRFLSRMLGRAE